MTLFALSCAGGCPWYTTLFVVMFYGGMTLGMLAIPAIVIWVVMSPSKRKRDPAR